METNKENRIMEDYGKLASDFAHLARLAVNGSRDDVELYVRRVAKRLGKSDPKLADKLQKTLGTPHRGGVLRDASIPVDTDSRLELVRSESPTDVGKPIWSETTTMQIDQFVAERSNLDALAEASLTPSRSLLFTGPPGVGKTLTARWLAAELSLPILTLDLSAVMSSFLGRTGNNLRNVLDYARGMSCVLLLDEFDAIAKRRDDSVEVGELKRLVTVLLQEIDSWPAKGILVAATNHADLLDPAVWRRFDLVVNFDPPDEEHTRLAVRRFLNGSEVSSEYEWLVAKVLAGQSFSDVERELTRTKREAVISRSSVEKRLLELMRVHVGAIPKSDRLELALMLVRNDVSQHEAHRITGVARDTIRKHASEQGNGR